MSSFSYIDAEDEVGTPFQALSIAESIEKKSPSFASYRDVKLAIGCGAVAGLGKMIELEDNKSRAGIGYSSGVFNDKGLFKSGGFIHADQSEEVAAILEEDVEDNDNFVIPGGICQNWVAVDVPTVIHRSKLILKPIEHNDPTPSPNCGFPVFESRYDQLNLIEEKRLAAMCHGQLYQQRMKKAFDKKVKPCLFREGDLVLKKVLSFAPDSRGKWTPNYEGPYVVKRAFSGCALMLTTMDGEDFTRPVNSDAVKKYFA
ncbi:hypothetical protein KIW84_031875 [Lathyrus oleraceus]|uniref:Uncharacterized protein n=1 Tax=Pisum sativum TaxID=3888 RepID=A0A9D5B163_PEA|nr:hypothetical protein KIW84_031875 [Pisum sativum]